MPSIRRATDLVLRPTLLTVPLILLLLAVIAAPSMAARNAGGAMVLHVDNTVNYSAGQNYCTVSPLPATCEELVTNVTKDPSIEAVIWIVAAFPDNSSPGVNAFQVGIAGDIPADHYTAFAPCGPGVLEIPDPAWPAPGTGTACAFTSTVFDRLFKMYWFAATAPGIGSSLRTVDYPGGDRRAEWADDSNPTQVDYCDRFGTVTWGGPGGNQCPGLLHQGACCFPDGHCEALEQSACSGQYMGDNTVCDPNPCQQPRGACCFSDASCQDLTAADCTAAGGVWEGYGTACATFQCPQPTGACCFADGHCTVLTQAECQQQQGSYHGHGTVCVPNPCPQPQAACCLPNGTCQDLTAADCATAGGVWEGYGTACATFQCPQPTGACCFADGHCTVLTQAECQQQQGTYHGHGTACVPNPCPQPQAACCFPNGTCQDLTAADCAAAGGVWEGYGTACTTFQCPQPGACCFTDGSCIVEMQSDCDSQGGTWQGVGSVCIPNPCPQRGACCFADGHCTVLDQSECQQQQGSYQGTGTGCDPNPCPPPVGACCTDGACADLTEGDCQNQGGVWEGYGTACASFNCPPAITGACCLGSNCEVLTQHQCQQQHGMYWGDNTSCFPNPCCTTGPKARLEHPTRPTLFVRGGGARNVAATRGDVCWSEPPDMNGLIASSEQILAFGLETELANDFIPTGDVSHVTWWGGFFNNSDPCRSGIPTPGFNLRFYDDGGCVPGTIVADISITTFTEEPVCCQQGVFPMFKWGADVSFAAINGTLYWFAAQMKDHAFPPQAGRLASGGVLGCESVFRSAYFGFPDWTRVIDVFGFAFDCSQEFTCEGGPSNPGACCFEDGRCSILTHGECQQQRGTYQGDGTSCDPNPCPPAGACCFLDGHCTILIEARCQQQGGSYHGAGTTCDPNPCPQPGACCFADGNCAIFSGPQCQDQGGSYQGDGTVCDPNPCPQPGACCFHDGHCAFELQSICSNEGGVWQGAGVGCYPNPCPQPPGACCFVDGHCASITRDECQQQGGSYQGDDAPCDPNPCTHTGACCFHDGHCTVLTQLQCQQQGGNYQADGLTCDPNPCPQPTGACCFSDQHCAVLTQAECQQQGGTYRGNDVPCYPNPCIFTGACCFGSSQCTILTQAECEQQGGRYMGDNTSCNPSPCCGQRTRHQPRPAGPMILFAGGSGSPNVVGTTRDICWSEPADLNGLIGSSEQILAFGLETELANDFVAVGSITHATWWGGFYNNSTPCASGISTPGFNLRFYADSDCGPGTTIADMSVTTFTEESVGCQQGVFPMFKWGADIYVNVSVGSRYWFGAQMKDHAFPPQAGRLAAGLVTGLDTMFKSAYFSYPDWTPVVDVFGVAFDCSQEFTCGGSTPRLRTTWGHIKGLYH